MLGEVLFMQLGFNIFILQGRGLNEVNIIGDFLNDFNVMCRRGNTYDITMVLFDEDAINEIKLIEKLVKRENMLNIFSFAFNYYNKAKHLVQNETPFQQFMRLKLSRKIG